MIAIGTGVMAPRVRPMSATIPDRAAIERRAADRAGPTGGCGPPVARAIPTPARTANNAAARPPHTLWAQDSDPATCVGMT